MKTLKTFLIALVALVASTQAASSFYSNTGTRDPLVVKGDPFAILVMDVKLEPGDTMYSRPIDLINMPINYRDTGTGDAALVPDLGQGNAIVSCYDIYDTTGTDSVDVTGQFYVSQYAGNNNDPYQLGERGGKNDAWATLGSAYSLDAASASSAIVEATAAVTLSSQLDRFVRVRLINDNDDGTTKDEARCRVYWTKKTINR